jgi:acyl-CoA synthetase (AMP-forming)/AMP-acid ligase II
MAELVTTDRTLDGAGALADLVLDEAVRAPRRPWVEHARTGRCVDRADLARVVAAWEGQDVAGRRLGLVAADPVAFAVLYVALIAAGATVIPLDATASPESNRQLLTAAGAAAVVCTTDDDGRQPGAVTADAASLMPLRPGGHTAAAATATAAATEGGCLLFSSGSTGPRKPIRLAEAQLLHVARCVAAAHWLGPTDRCLNPLPLFHVNAEVVALLASLVSGGTVVLDPGFHRTGFWPLVADRSITWINAVPAIVAVLAREPAGPPAPPAVRFVRSASAPLAAAVLERFERRYDVPVVESYGMTEAASQITANPLGDRRPGSVGVPVGVELRVVGGDGRDLPAGDVGRVLIRGRGVIRGYADGAGSDRFDAAGWLDTGDLGSLDVDGYLRLAGRDGDVVNRSGEKIFPREIEDVLRGHPAVREAVVVARDDDVLGQVPVAYVVADGLADGLADVDRDLLARGLTERCAAALPRTHRPAEIQVVTGLPLGPTGKAARRLVAAQDARRSQRPGASAGDVAASAACTTSVVASTASVPPGRPGSDDGPSGQRWPRSLTW